jgi:AbrB family looped-hinge helix DNA binding protein
MWLHRITRAGQVSIPAGVRERWDARAVVIEDRGDHLVLRPAAETPLAALRGVFPARPGSTASDVAVRALRSADSDATEAAWQRQRRGA